MAELRELLDEFAAELRAGRDPDPQSLLERASAGERQKLAAMIDSLLMTAPRRAWDPVDFESSTAKQAVEQVYESIDGVSGSWPELLPRLRNRARLRRRDLVERLAGALGVGDGPRRIEKVGDYYNRMEHGLLPAEGVSERVIDALAEIVGASGAAIRRAGLRAEPGAGAAAGGGAVFARVASRMSEPSEGQASPGEAPARDEIDELFTGGRAAL